MQNVGCTGGVLIQHFLCPCLPWVTGVHCCVGNKGCQPQLCCCADTCRKIRTERGRALALSAVPSNPGSLMALTSESSVLTLFCIAKTLGCLNTWELVQRGPLYFRCWSGKCVGIFSAKILIFLCRFFILPLAVSEVGLASCLCSFFMGD